MITGYTKLFVIVADPIAHVRTPQIFNDYLQKAGTDAVLVPAHVAPDRLRTVVSGLKQIHNLKGIIVTVPHKIAIVDLCDELDDSARIVGAVNIIKRNADGRLIGANFDGVGFADVLERNVGSVAGKSIFMAGAGGVARAITFNLARRGISRLSIYNRSTEKTDGLIAELRSAYPAISFARADNRPSSGDIAINATSVGMKQGDGAAFSVERLPDHTAVAEVIMQPLMTPLLIAAQQRGLHIVTGESMLISQLPSWMKFIDQPAAPIGAVPDLIAAAD